MDEDTPNKQSRSRRKKGTTVRVRSLRNAGNQAEALEILEQHVIGQTGEPRALYQAGIILKESGREAAAKVQLNAALEASFELGPVVAEEIRGHLRQL